MKQLSSLVLIMVLAISSALGKDRVSAHTTVKGDHISITYGQPKMKGRVIFGGLVPYDQVWRTGADEATEITIDKECVFAGMKLNPGTYTLFTIPGKDNWVLILNSKLGQWGAFDYEKVKDQDVLKAKAHPTMLKKPVETFTIEIKNDGFTMSWDKTSVFVSTTF